MSNLPRTHLDFVPLAHAFREKIRAQNIPAGLAEIDARNNATGFDSGVCHTHDFVDANQLMIDAMEFMGRPWVSVADIEDETQTGFMNDAWNLAKESGFNYREIETIETATGPHLAFCTAYGTDITDPYSTEDGRFQVDPIQYYGLDADQAAQFTNHWARVKPRGPLDDDADFIGTNNPAALWLLEVGAQLLAQAVPVMQTLADSDGPEGDRAAQWLETYNKFKG